MTLLRLTLKEKLETISIQRSLTWKEDAKLTDEIERVDTYNETVFSALIKADKLFKDTPTTQPPSAPATPPPAYSHPYSQWHFPSFNWDATMLTWLSGPVSGSRLKQLMTVILISREPRSSTICSLLEGAAREAITGLSLTEANYREAVATLKKRFGGTQQIVSKHMEAVLQVEALSESATFVRQQQLSHKKPCFVGSEGGDIQRPPVPLPSLVPSSTPASDEKLGVGLGMRLLCPTGSSWFTAHCEQEGPWGRIEAHDSACHHWGRDCSQGETRLVKGTPQRRGQVSLNCHYVPLWRRTHLLLPKPAATVTSNIIRLNVQWWFKWTRASSCSGRQDNVSPACEGVTSAGPAGHLTVAGRVHTRICPTTQEESSFGATTSSPAGLASTGHSDTVCMCIRKFSCSHNKRQGNDNL